MTKQEQIEEMAKTACDACAPHNICPLTANLRPCGASLEYAKAIYDVGYRKADMVRKETAKEILDMLYDMGIDNEILESGMIFDVNGVSLAKQICEKYGVENKNEQDTSNDTARGCNRTMATERVEIHPLCSRLLRVGMVLLSARRT